MVDGTAALEEDGTATRKMIGAGFANKVMLLFRKHTVKAIFTRRRCHVDSEHNPAVGAKSGVETDGELSLLDPLISCSRGNRFLPPLVDSENFLHISEAI